MSCSGIILIVSTIILFAGNVTWIVIQFIEFNGCAFPLWQMSFTALAGVAMYVLVLMRTRSDASIFTSSLVLTYNLYLQWSALSSNPDQVCNPYTSSAGNTTFLMIMGLVFTFISLLVISAATFKEEEQEKKDVVATSINAPLMEKETAEDVKIAEENAERKARGEKPIQKALPITSATIFFQALLILAAVYYSMLLTNWGTPTLFSTSSFSFFTKSEYSFWIQMVAQWVSVLVYLFSMTAPLCCPDRDFS